MNVSMHMGVGGRGTLTGMNVSVHMGVGGRGTLTLRNTP